MHLDTLKAEVCGGIAAMRGPLLEISHGIHDNPELAFEEHHAHRLLTRAIRDAGLAGGRAGGFRNFIQSQYGRLRAGEI